MQTELRRRELKASACLAGSLSQYDRLLDLSRGQFEFRRSRQRREKHLRIREIREYDSSPQPSESGFALTHSATDKSDPEFTAGSGVP